MVPVLGPSWVILYQLGVGRERGQSYIILKCHRQRGYLMLSHRWRSIIIADVTNVVWGMQCTEGPVEHCLTKGLLTYVGLGVLVLCLLAGLASLCARLSGHGRERWALLLRLQHELSSRGPRTTRDWDSNRDQTLVSGTSMNSRLPRVKTNGCRSVESSEPTTMVTRDSSTDAVDGSATSKELK